jgi:hypothetical protein
VLAWLIGLFLAPSAPDPFGSAVTINAYFSAHRPAAMIQSVFIHGLAGVALLRLTAALWSYLAARDTAGPRRVMLAAGVLAAAVSFLQVAFMIAIPAGDHHVRLYEEGAGSPVVVIIAGRAGAELRSVIPTAAQAKRLLAGHTIPVPLAVIASSAFGDKWVSWQREIATLSATGSFTFTGTRSHNIHLRQAAAVTAAVGEIASPAGTNRPRQETPRS